MPGGLNGLELYDPFQATHFTRPTARLLEMAYDNQNPNSYDNATATVNTGADQSTAVRDFSSDLLNSSSSFFSDLRSGNGGQGSGNSGSDSRFGKQGQRCNAGSGGDGYSISFGDAFNSNSETQSKDGTPGSGDPALDLGNLASLYGMSAAHALNKEGQGKDKDCLGDEKESLEDELDNIFGDDETDDSDDEEDESDDDDEDGDGHGNEDCCDDDGDADAIVGNALSVSAQVSQFALEGDLASVNSFDLEAIYGQLEATKCHMSNTGRNSELSYTQSYVADAMSKKGLASRVATSTTAIGGDLSALSHVLAGLNSGGTVQSAIRQFNPQTSRSA